MRLRVLVIAIGMTGPLLLPGAAAAAPPVERDKWTDAWSFTTDECGTDVLVEGTAHGLWKVTAAPRDPHAEAFLASNNWHVRETVTSLETRRSFKVVENGLFKERTATHLPGYTPPEGFEPPPDPDTGEALEISDYVYRFTQTEVVNVLVKSSRGAPLYRARAVMRHVVVFDTRGDGEPGGFVIEEDTTYLSGSDPWAGYDFCGFVGTLHAPATAGRR